MEFEQPAVGPNVLLLEPPAILLELVHVSWSPQSVWGDEVSFYEVTHQ